MKERPIIMSAESVQAILDGRKTQTRRVVKVANDTPCGVGVHFDGKTNVLKAFYINANGDINDYRCPYGQIGDRLWVKESFHKYEEDGEHIVYKNSKEPTRVFKRIESYEVGKWNSPLFMPRSLSRLTLEITNIRVERLQDITQEDVAKEGIISVINDKVVCSNPNDTFIEQWNKLNAKRGYSWESNPFVWVIEFMRIEE